MLVLTVSGQDRARGVHGISLHCYVFRRIWLEFSSFMHSLSLHISFCLLLFYSIRFVSSLFHPLSFFGLLIQPLYALQSSSLPSILSYGISEHHYFSLKFAHILFSLSFSLLLCIFSFRLSFFIFVPFILFQLPFQRCQSPPFFPSIPWPLSFLPPEVLSASRPIVFSLPHSTPPPSFLVHLVLCHSLLLSLSVFLVPFFLLLFFLPFLVLIFLSVCLFFLVFFVFAFILLSFCLSFLFYSLLPLLVLLSSYFSFFSFISFFLAWLFRVFLDSFFFPSYLSVYFFLLSSQSLLFYLLVFPFIVLFIFPVPSLSFLIRNWIIQIIDVIAIRFFLFLLVTFFGI